MLAPPGLFYTHVLYDSALLGHVPPLIFNTRFPTSKSYAERFSLQPPHPLVVLLHLVLYTVYVFLTYPGWNEVGGGETEKAKPANYAGGGGGEAKGGGGGLK